MAEEEVEDAQAALGDVRDVLGNDFEATLEEVPSDDDVEEVAGGATPKDAIRGKVSGKRKSSPPSASDPEGEERATSVISAEEYRKRAAGRQELAGERDRLRQELAGASRREEEMKSYLNVLLRRMSSKGTGQDQPSEEELFPNVDPEVRAAIRHEMEKVNAPLIDQAKTTAKERQRMAELQAQQQDWQGFLQQLGAEEQEYRQSELGHGYDERLQRYSEAFSGVLQGLANDFPDSRINDSVIQNIQVMNQLGMTQLARQLGVPVPALVDAYNRAILGADEASSRRSSPELAAAQAVVRDGVGNGRRGETGSPGDPLDVEYLMEHGIGAKQLEQIMEGEEDWADVITKLAEKANRMELG